MKKNIAIIGTGISGLTCAHLLSKKHAVTVYEANDYIGGHTATKDVIVDGKSYAIDTGFIVFNDWTYPNFIKLMEQLGVAKQATEMSFSVTHLGTNIEYNGHNINTLFAQRRNWLRPRFWRIVKDILAFNKACKALVDTHTEVPAVTLYEFIQQQKLSEDFSQHYILPMCAAIWSASIEQTKQFPLAFFLKFFNNHGLLNIKDRPQWYTLIGGSRSYIQPLVANFKDNIRLNTAVTKVKRVNGQLEVTDNQGQQTLFDEVIFACHSDQALAMLDSPSPQQRSILSAIPYAQNDVVLHTDTTQLPKRKLAWASWNYRINGAKDEQQKPATVTYDMNILQCIDAPVTFCVSLNNDDIDNSKVLGRYQYSHPQFSETMVAAQQARSQICGVDQLHFCGAYWYNGFHEDGVRSALDVCARFGVSL